MDLEGAGEESKELLSEDVEPDGAERDEEEVDNDEGASVG